MSVQDIRASFVICPVGGEINVSARSYGEINVQVIMEALGGGGHMTMAGTQLRDMTVAQAEERVRAAIKEYFRQNGLPG